MGALKLAKNKIYKNNELKVYFGQNKRLLIQGLPFKTQKYQLFSTLSLYFDQNIEKKLIIAASNPYARKVRVSLQEKKIDHEVIVDVPWNKTL